MKHLVTLVSGSGWHVQDLRRASGIVGVQLDAIPFSQLTSWVGGSATLLAAKIPLMQCDGVLVRMMPPGSLEQVVFRMDALHRLASIGVPVLNPPGAVEASVDKYATLARMDAQGLPVPLTWVGESAAAAMDAFRDLGEDVVVKPLFGSEGRGLVRVTETEVARRVFHALERVGSVLYVQQYIPHKGNDLRVFVLGSRVLGGIRRHAPTGDWRTNVAIGGRAEPFSPDDATASLAFAPPGPSMRRWPELISCPTGAAT